MSTRRELRRYFDRFPEFNYDESEETMAQFRALSKQEGWQDDKLIAERLEVKTAIALQFKESYGADLDDLATWQRLCSAMGLDPIPDNVADCRKKFKRTHVNIVDLVDAYGTTDSVDMFETVKALAKYSK